MDKIDINCRFCSKLFDDKEDIYEVTNEIKEMFENFTNTQLELSIIQKSYACQKCLVSLQAANVVKNQFIANQELLLTVDRFECESTMEIDDFIIDQYITTPVNVKKTMLQETESVEPIMTAEVTENPTKKHKLDSSSSDSSCTPSNEATTSINVKVPRQTVNPSELGQCHICFRRMKDVKTHCFHYHKHVMPTCDKCGKSFFKKENLEQHMINQHTRRRLPCQYCPENDRKSYLTKGSLRLHIKIKHPEFQNQHI